MVVAASSSKRVRVPQAMGRSNGIIDGLIQWLMFTAVATVAVAMAVLALTGGAQGHAEQMYDAEEYLSVMGEPKPGSADGYISNAEPTSSTQPNSQ